MALETRLKKLEQETRRHNKITYVDFIHYVCDLRAKGGGGKIRLSWRQDNLSFTAHHEIAAARKRTRYNMEEETEVCEVSPMVWRIGKGGGIIAINFTLVC